MNKILNFDNFINENLEDLWKTYVTKLEPDTSGKIKSFIDKKEMNIDIYKNMLSDIITNIISKFTEISSLEIEDSQKIKKIGQQLFIFFTVIETFLSNISDRYPKKKDLYQPSSILKDAKSPINNIFSYNTDDFSKNLSINIIKLLTDWGKQLDLSNDGIEKIKKFQLFEENIQGNAVISKYIEFSTNLMTYIKEFSYKKLQEIIKKPI
ncbi:hypothetical protein M0Q50_02675 [bacterium]|jgi:hypothetical protein|nr:hypothetical protein [bacterium]